MPHACHLTFSAKHLDSSREPLTSVAESFGHVAPGLLKRKGHGKPVDLLVNEVGLLPLLADHSWYDGTLITVRVTLRIHVVEGR